MNRNSIVPRGYIKFLQILGTFLTAIILVVTIYALASDQDINLLSDSDKIIWAVLIAIEAYMLWKSIYSAIVIIRYMAKASDEEIIENRFIMSVLSLGVGGFITPFILTSLPKTESKSTINPRVFLAKHLGFTMLVGFIIFAIIVIVFPVSYGVNIQFIMQDPYGYVSIGIAVIGVLIGFLGFAFFASKNSSAQLQEKSALGFTMQVIGVIFTIIATVEIVFLAIMSLIRIIAVIADSVRYAINADGFMKVFAIFMMIANISFQMMYLAMLLKIYGSILKGLWAKGQVITIQQFSKVEDAELDKRKKPDLSRESF